MNTEQINKMKTNELTNAIINDGQLIRATENYLVDTFNQVKGLQLNDVHIENMEQFYETLMFICEMKLKALEETT